MQYILARIASFDHWLARQRHKSDPREVVLQDLLDYHSMLRQRRKKYDGQPLSLEYCHNHLHALRGYYQFLHERGLILLSPCNELPTLRAPKPLPKGILSAAQAVRLLNQPKLNTLFGFRDRVILELLYSSGLRGLEACRLTIYDLNLGDQMVTVRRGKGGKDRVVPIGKVATDYLREYLDKVRPKMMARVSSPAAVDRLFFSRLPNPLQPQMLYHMIRQYRKKAGLPATITTHSLRHTCATEMLRGGASIRHVQEMLGHSKMTTTQIYTRVVPVDLQKVHRRTAPSERRKSPEAETFQREGWGGEKRKRRKRRKQRASRP